jgi:adenine-specific DNA methylase
MTGHKKKLIEVALPLDAINKASASEKSIRPRAPEHATSVVWRRWAADVRISDHA